MSRLLRLAFLRFILFQTILDFFFKVADIIPLLQALWRHFPLYTVSKGTSKLVLISHRLWYVRKVGASYERTRFRFGFIIDDSIATNTPKTFLLTTFQCWEVETLKRITLQMKGQKWKRGPDLIKRSGPSSAFSF